MSAVLNVLIIVGMLWLIGFTLRGALDLKRQADEMRDARLRREGRLKESE